MESSSSRSVFLGVDVGTTSARAGLFRKNGLLLSSANTPIQIWKDGDFIEQSSTDIWHAVCASVKAACSLADVSGDEVEGLGFAATCSLVAVDADGCPVTVSLSGDPRRNVIVWMDHRAVKQAEFINSKNSPLLYYFGGSLSPEMQPPKLLWVKQNLKESWSLAFRWMDLSDWLSYRATGDDTRSLCTTVCKWTYLGHVHKMPKGGENYRVMEACGWDDDFWEEIGLGDLADGHHTKIENDKEIICSRMVLVCGTSTCHMAVSKNKLFIPGVWGPYWSAMVPEFWLTEGGQSASGAVLDFIIENHIAYSRLHSCALSLGISVFELLNKKLEEMAVKQNHTFLGALTKNLHVLPDFHGNRSPLAKPEMKGLICGLTIDNSEKQLALLYLAVVQALAYGTRHILEHCNSHGHKIHTLMACGGLSKNPLFIQEHSNITGFPIIIPREKESVLLGAAILGAVATGVFSGLQEAMKMMNGVGEVTYPRSDRTVKEYHMAKYGIFLDLYNQQTARNTAMEIAMSSQPGHN